MAGRSLTACWLLLAGALVLPGCGRGGNHGIGVSQPAGHPTARAAKGLPPPSRFLAVDAPRHTVTITLIASYDGTNGGFNFDGYSRFLMWTVPRGWMVRVKCENRGPLRHSCAVVQGAGTTTPAFSRATIPHPLTGLEAGQIARFTFRASRTGIYRFACLVPGHELARMYDVLRVVRNGKPSAVSLLAAR